MVCFTIDYVYIRPKVSRNELMQEGLASDELCSFLSDEADMIDEYYWPQAVTWPMGFSWSVFLAQAVTGAVLS